MSLTHRLARLALAAAAMGSLALLPRAATAQPAATFLAAIGDVQIIDAAGQQRPGERGGPLTPGDRIVVGASGLAQLRFSDGGLVSLRANSELRIDAYAYRGERDSAASSVLQLVKGGLRAITGAIARLNRPGYSVVTTNATIGVRGTDFEVFHIPPPIPGAAPPPGEPGTYLKVNEGIAFLQTPGGILDVLPQQAAVVLQVGAAPAPLPQVPQFMRGPPAVPAPTPQQPQQRSEQPFRAAPGALTAPTTAEPRQSPTVSPTLTSPTLSPELTAPTTTSPTLSPTSPTMTAPTTSPTMTAPATSPIMTAPTTSPAMTAPATSPIMTAPATSPMMTAPPPTMTAPR